MNDLDFDTCAHGKPAGVKCIFCPDQVAKVPRPATGAKLANPAPKPPPSVAGVRKAPSEPAHRAAGAPRIGNSAEIVAPRVGAPFHQTPAAEREAASRTQAARRKVAKKAPETEALPEEQLTAKLAERMHAGDVLLPSAPPAETPQFDQVDQPLASRPGYGKVTVSDSPCVPSSDAPLFTPPHSVPVPEVATFVLSVNIGTVACQHLHALVRTGFYGTSIERVAEILLLEGMRRARGVIEDGEA